MIKDKCKILIISNVLMHYRIDVFNTLADRGYDLTVGYGGAISKDDSIRFKQISLDSCKIGPFVLHRNNLYDICCKFDVVVAMFNTRWLSLMRLGFFSRRPYKLLYWGIGVSASYKNKYGQKSRWDGIRFYFGRRADALIFYDDWPISRYLNAGFIREKLFIAYNTVGSSQVLRDMNIKRNSFLFVGTLYKGKGIEELLYAYSKAFETEPQIFPLNIIGGGEQLEWIKTFVEINNLANNVNIVGPVYDGEKLEVYYRHAIACISPNQAGLSVLSSFSHGTPFVTKKNAITGGERNNIISEVNGYLYEGDHSELSGVLLMLYRSPELAETWGKNAKIHYDSFRTVDCMANGFEDAIRYSVAKS